MPWQFCVITWLTNFVTWKFHKLKVTFYTYIKQRSSLDQCYSDEAKYGTIPLPAWAFPSLGLGLAAGQVVVDWLGLQPVTAVYCQTVHDDLLSSHITRICIQTHCYHSIISTTRLLWIWCVYWCWQMSMHNVICVSFTLVALRYCDNGRHACNTSRLYFRNFMCRKYHICICNINGFVHDLATENCVMFRIH